MRILECGWLDSFFLILVFKVGYWLGWLLIRLVID